MKLKTILLSLFLLLSTSVLADNNDNCYTSADVKTRDGLYYLVGQDNPFTGTSRCVYSDTGQIKSLGEIKNGKRDGKWTYWHRDGQLGAEGNFKDGKLDGKWTWWHKDGTIEKVEYYENGELVN
jgi:antitoxin component YwqK of YwqJK toxin-antitoxin module